MLKFDWCGVKIYFRLKPVMIKYAFECHISGCFRSPPFLRASIFSFENDNFPFVYEMMFGNIWRIAGLDYKLINRHRNEIVTSCLSVVFFGGWGVSQESNDNLCITSSSSITLWRPMILHIVLWQRFLIIAVFAFCQNPQLAAAWGWITISYMTFGTFQDRFISIFVPFIFYVC